MHRAHPPYHNGPRGDRAAGSTGLRRCTGKPACSARRRSSPLAHAVSAMAGTRASAPPRARSLRISAAPSSPGMARSLMRTSGESRAMVSSASAAAATSVSRRRARLLRAPIPLRPRRRVRPRRPPDRGPLGRPAARRARGGRHHGQRVDVLVDRAVAALRDGAQANAAAAAPGDDLATAPGAGGRRRAAKVAPRRAAPGGSCSRGRPLPRTPAGVLRPQSNPGA